MTLWSTKRRLLYGGSVFVVFMAIVILISVSFFYKPPTCNDGKKNGDEQGIDCGGSCNILCVDNTLTPVVLWSKVFNVSDDLYSVAAFVENPNINSENKEAGYKFSIYDDKNELITVIEGVTSIPKNKKFLVFDTGILLKNAKPKLTDFKFTSFGSWQKNTENEPEISVEYKMVNATSTTPSLVGKIYNKSQQNFPRTELVVIVLDNKENAIAVSRTFVDDLLKNSSQDFVFTWRRPFIGDVSVVNIIHRFIQK